MWGGFGSGQGNGPGPRGSQISGPLSPFGELLTAEITPDVQIDAIYGLSTEEHETFSATGGSATASNSMFTCASGTSVGGYGVIRSKRSVRYRPGQGVIGRFTASYTTGVANSQQMAGLFTAERGLWVGYNGTSFGVMRQNGAALEVQTLTLTAGASGTESLTITLNGVDYTFNVSSGTATANATTIAAQSYTGWNAYQVVDSSANVTVVFAATAVGDKASTFSFVNNTGGGTCAASFAETQAGASHTETWVYQSSFNLDPLDGTGASGITLDPTKLNVWQIELQWLGAGAITYSVENPTTGRFVPFHRIAYANNNTEPSLTNPALKVGWVAYSLGSSTALTVKGASAAILVCGPSRSLRDAHGVSNSKTAVGTNYTSIVSVRCSAVYGGKINLSKLVPLLATVAVDGTKPAEVALILNGTLAGAPAWTQSSVHSAAEYDTAGTTVSGGSTVYSAAVAKDGGIELDLSRYKDSLKLEREDTLTIAVKASSGTTDASASITWGDD